MKQIPYSHQFIDRDDIEGVLKDLKSDWITQGPKIKEFENALCKCTGAKYAVCVSSGTAALHIAYLAAGIKAGDEAITSAITFVASANCILYCGGRPIFADIQEDTANIAPEKIERKITRRTKAIIPVHFAGYPCDLKEISEISRRNKLIVIEDAAHALGAEYRNTNIGSCPPPLCIWPVILQRDYH
jgi:dTDP-4-amino-4,6-dideoxygalactose transaminase